MTDLSLPVMLGWISQGVSWWLYIRLVSLLFRNARGHGGIETVEGHKICQEFLAEVETHHLRFDQSGYRAGILASERGGFPKRTLVEGESMEMVYFTNATLVNLLVQFKMLGDFSYIVVTLHLLLTTQTLHRFFDRRFRLPILVHFHWCGVFQCLQEPWIWILLLNPILYYYSYGNGLQ